MRKMLKDFVRDRDGAFASKDEKRILAYCKKYDIQVPKDKDLFWAGVHKAVCNLFLSENSLISIESYQESYEWLKEHGYSPSIGGKK